MGSNDYKGGERRADEHQRKLVMDKLAGAVETMVAQNGEQTKMISDMQKEVSDIKLDVQAVVIGQKSFLRSYDKQVDRCTKIQDDHETRLRDMPEHRCFNEHRIDVLEDTQSGLVKNVYKAMGVGIVLMLIATVVGPFVIKKLTGN